MPPMSEGSEPTESTGLPRREAIRLSMAALLGSALAARAGDAPQAAATPLDAGPTPAGFPWKKTVLEVTPGEALAGGGRMIAVNGATPGPEIRLKRGDYFHATIRNALGDPITIHWHGMIVPNLMDGVPDVTQLALAPDRSQTTAYPIVQSGTYWYHSHSGFQEQLGLAGPLIIEDPDEPRVADRELVLFIEDRLNVDPRAVYDALQGKPAPEAAVAATKEPENAARFGGIDGKPFKVDVFYTDFPINGQVAPKAFVFEAKPGERLRLRIINGSASTYFRFAVEGHPLEVIAKDGNPVVPARADSILLAAAERYDALVTVEDEGIFRMTADALGQTTGGLAVLRVGGAPLPENPPAPVPGKPIEGKVLTVADLVAPASTVLPEGPAREVTLELGGDMKAYRWSLNGEYYPDAKPLPIKAGERVVIEFRNKTMMPHPMHLHGHFFRLIDPAAQDPDRTPLMDTVSVAPGASVRVEFFTDNPGAWVCHCHNLYHLVAGMLRVFVYTA